MICKSCGGENNNNEQFCKYCHTQLENNVVQSQPMYQQPMYQQPMYQQPINRPVKNSHPILIIILIFAFVIGFGIVSYYIEYRYNKKIKGDWYCAKTSNIENVKDITEDNATTHVTFKYSDTFIWSKNKEEDKHFYLGTYKLTKKGDNKYRLYNEVEEAEGDGSSFKGMNITYDVTIDGNTMTLKNTNLGGNAWQCIKK